MKKLTGLLVIFLLLSVLGEAQTLMKPPPGVNFNYSNPLCPISRGGMVLPLNEGSGTPRVYLATQQYVVATTTTDRLASFTSAGWDGYASKSFGGPTIHATAANGITDCGVHSDFLAFDQGTIIVGYKKTDSNNNALVSTGTNTFSQLIITHIYGSGKADFLWGGNTEGTNQLTSGTGFPLGDDVWAFSTGPRGMEIYQNGGLIASNTSNPIRTSTFHDFQIGVHAFWGSSETGEYSFVYCYPVQLTQEEIRYISRDPFCFYDWGEDQFKGTAGAQKRGDFFSPLVPPELNLLNRLQLPRYLK